MHVAALVASREEERRGEERRKEKRGEERRGPLSKSQGKAILVRTKEEWVAKVGHVSTQL